MKNKVKYLISILALTALTVQAADTLRVNTVYPGSPALIVNSADGSAANKTYATNGIYPKGILADIPVTNHVVIAVPGDNLALQFNAGGCGGASTAVLTLKACVTPPSLVYNNSDSGGITYGMGGFTNANPMTPFATITLATTGTGIQSTNVWWTPSTTPALGAMPYIVIEKITAGSSYPTTNYSVWVNSR